MSEERGFTSLWRRLGSVGQLVLPLFLLFLVVSLFLGAWISRSVKSSLLNQASRTVVSLHGTLEMLLDENQAEFAGKVADPILSARLAAVLERGSIDLLQTTLENVREGIGADLLHVCSASGRLICSSNEVGIDVTPPAYLFDLMAQRPEEVKGNAAFIELTDDALRFFGINEVKPLDRDGKALAMITLSPLEDDFGDTLAVLMALRVLNGEKELTRGFSRFIGAGVSLFQGDMRISTTLSGEKGKSLVGSTLDNDVAEEVLSGSGSHNGSREIAGKPYQLKYSKLKDYRGKAVGILATSLEVGTFLAEAAHVRKQVMILGFCSLLVFGGLLLVVIRRYFRSIRDLLNRVLEYMQSVAAGNLNERLELRRHGEFAALGEGINSTVAKLAGLIQSVEGAFGNVEKVNDILRKISASLASEVEKSGEVTRTLDQSSSQLSSVMEKVSHDMERTKDSSRENLSSLMELSSSVDSMAKNSETLSSSSDDTSSAIEQMSSSISQMSSSFETVTATIDDSSTSMRGIEQAIQEIREFTNDAKALSETLSSTASVKGRDAMSLSLKRMEKIESIVTHLGETVEQVGHRAVAIGEVVSLITDIADQTNLLSLNASILAAQAGAEGKGFSVVADEIRNLAEKTNNSIREIKKIVEDIQTESQDAIVKVDAGVGEVTAGVKDFSQLRTVLEEIIGQSSRSRDLAGNVATRTEGQAAGSSQVAKAFEGLAETARELNAAAREQDKTGRHIMGISENVRNLTSQMQITAREQAETVKVVARKVQGTDAETKQTAEVVAQAHTQLGEIRSAMEVISRVGGEVQSGVSELKSAVDLLANETTSVRENLSFFKIDRSE